MLARRFQPGMAAIYIILIVGVAVTITPLLWTVSTSFKTEQQLSAWPPEWIPNPIAWANYPDALTTLPFDRYFLNTMVLVAAAEFGALITCSFVAYGFARMEFPGRETLFLIMISTMLMPYIVRLVPLFVFYGEIGWLGTYLPLAIPDMLGRNAFYIFLLRQFFKGIPEDLSDAARIDGANDFRIWWTMVLPMSKPALATVGIFAFQSTWDEFLGPLVYMGGNPDMRTLAVGLYMLRNVPGGDNLMPYLMAMSTLMIIPILLIFGFGQRYLVQGVTMSGLKGRGTPYFPTGEHERIIKEHFVNEAKTDILVVGAGLGGVGGALAALQMGRNVILTEETDWIGGQLTSQAVPPDEHWLIESCGATASYRRLREGIRDYYRRNYPLRPGPRFDPRLNPGQGNVSRLCHEPRIALAAMHEMLAPYLSNGQLRLWLETVPVAVETADDLIISVTVRSIRSGEETVVTAPYVLDATETGDVLDLGNVEHVLGSEARSETNELHALDVADPLDQQAVTWCFPVSHHPGEDHTIGKPDQYDFWRDYQADFWPDKQLSWYDVHPQTLETRHRAIFAFPEDGENNDFWHYRRIVYSGHYPDGFTTDVTMVNWPQIDYWLGPIVGVDDNEREKHLEGSRQLSLSFLHWMQTEAPRHDGGNGYPGLKLRPELVDTEDGLAKYVYIREGRRIQAEFTVLEEHVGVEQRRSMGESGPAKFHDSVGIGYYRIDLHPSTGNRTYVDIDSFPFQIPLGSLIPVRMKNLLPANKNIGTTHITNGCYRLHPVEWNIGEAAGALAARSLDRDLPPTAIRNRPEELESFQDFLTRELTIELDWPSTMKWQGQG